MPRTGKNTLPQDFDWYAWERRAQQAGYPLVCGIDEAGRGPLAGPVCAAAVILPLDCAIGEKARGPVSHYSGKGPGMGHWLGQRRGD